ncbi:MAG: hypothetical protein CSB23_05390 [Deltaproteobacteria bacterium]|nr:MAG: hypothetical protein CSB23_05390 [Deltaproteobacteria bacterium]
MKKPGSRQFIFYQKILPLILFHIIFQRIVHCNRLFFSGKMKIFRHLICLIFIFPIVASFFPGCGRNISSFFVRCILLSFNIFIMHTKHFCVSREEK